MKMISQQYRAWSDYTDVQAQWPESILVAKANNIFRFQQDMGYRLTLVKCEPSLLRGTDGNDLFGFISREPALRLYKLLIIIRRSDVVFTGKNRLRGTFIPEKVIHITMNFINIFKTIQVRGGFDR